MNFKIIIIMMMMMIIIINSFCNHCLCSILQHVRGYRHRSNINLIFLIDAQEKLKEVEKGWGGGCHQARKWTPMAAPSPRPLWISGGSLSFCRKTFGLSSSWVSGSLSTSLTCHGR
jgi:hypothetical protein